MSVADSGIVLVTGATGSVGSGLIPLLAAGGVPVRALSRRGLASKRASPGIEALSVDLRDSVATAAALVGVERLFLVTPLEEDMAAVAQRVIEQAGAAGVRQVVRLSAFGAGGEAPTRLAAIHAQTEEVLHKSGIPFASLRPNAFMQNTVSQFADSIRRRGRFEAPQGGGRVSVIDTRDVAAVAAHLLMRSPPPTGCFELTGPAALSNYAIAEAFSRVLGREIEYVDSDAGETRAALLSQGLSAWLTDIIMELYALSARGAAARVTPDVAQVLGRAATSFEDFAAEHADRFR